MNRLPPPAFEAGHAGGKSASYAHKMPLSPSNALIAALTPEDRAVLMEASTPFDFAMGHVFCESGDEVCAVEFVDRGIISAVASLADGRTIETFMVGREGCTQPMASDAVTRCYSRLVAQIGGSGRRIDAPRLRALVDAHPGIRDVMAAYAVRLMGELEQSVACNALHRAEQRFAKWLLRCHDRIESDQMFLTQEFLASMLGSQRTTVNEAAQQLQRAGAVRYSRGKIVVLDRTALERASCECYGVHRATQDARVIHPRTLGQGR